MHLAIIGTGAVTAVGLTAPQCAAAIRARIAGFRQRMLFAPPRDPIVVAEVPANERRKASPETWLVNLAARAVDECLAGLDNSPRPIALLLAVPDRYRAHAGLAGGVDAFMSELEAKLEMRFHEQSRVIERGRASALASVMLARDLIERRDVDQCLIAGVDSLVNVADAQRMSEAGRLHEPGNPQGAILGEGAACVLVQSASDDSADLELAHILGAGAADEPDHALGEKHAVGRLMAQALGTATDGAQRRECEISFRISDMNGERYFAWDNLLSMTRFYRTRRERLEVWYPATCVGDVGAAAGPLSLVIAAMAFAGGYAPGAVAMCEGSSDDGLRAGCVVGSSANERSPRAVSH
jgi:3-oxoacyl-[acyl-carrier-protein] synthase I